MKVILNGAAGVMGQKVAVAINKTDDMQIVASCGIPLTTCEECGTYETISEYKGEADVVIDFSHHSATAELTAYCAARKLPVVIATTGQNDEERAMIAESAKETAVFFAANMSVGVAVTCQLAKTAASFFPDADIEIVEVHHNRKLDVPSGTALMLANTIKEVRPAAEYVIGRHENGKRQQGDIGIHALRMGNVVGIHEVHINTGTETITIKHEAADRALFADGAVVAARFIAGQSAGLYNMADIMK